MMIKHIFALYINFLSFKNQEKFIFLVRHALFMGKIETDFCWCQLCDFYLRLLRGYLNFFTLLNSRLLFLNLPWTIAIMLMKPTRWVFIIHLFTVVYSSLYGLILELTYLFSLLFKECSLLVKIAFMFTSLSAVHAHDFQIFTVI